MGNKTVRRIVWSVVILLLGGMLGFFIAYSEPALNPNFEHTSPFYKNHPFRLGLDLSGGSHLVYKADVSALESSQVDDSMEALRDVIERRVNLFGVSEPVVQVQKSGLLSGAEEKLIVDLPGITDLEKATEMIGQTPLLEFKTEIPEGEPLKATIDENGQVTIDPFAGRFQSTLLTGRYLEKAILNFEPTTRQPLVTLQFDETGQQLFAQITRDNVGKMVAIFLDGSPISTPVVQEEIPNGEAVISGNFTPTEARLLIGRLNSGALPVPITLVSTQTIGATLGGNAVAAGVRAGIIGFSLVALFLILWYRLPGLIAVIALLIFVAIMLTLFKLLPVTLTAAGIAGFIITIGVAVDANVLIFERIKEELKNGKTVGESVQIGWKRAWTSIRDSNFSGIISAIILFWLGTPLIKGFALTFGMGIFVSLFSAVMITKIFLSVFEVWGDTKAARFLFSSGLNR